jgi:putative CocE/NonD family hydrolase
MRILMQAGSQPDEDDGFRAEAPETVIRKERMQVTQEMLRVRDGTRLETEIVLPAGSGPFPCLLARTVYGILELREKARGLCEQGYAVVTQNPRGTYASEGAFEFGAGRGEDGFDTIDWITKQSWCNGQVGTFGGSALAAAQMTAAFLCHPAHRAMALRVLPFGLMSHFGGAYLFTQIPMALHIMQVDQTAHPRSSIDWMKAFNVLPVVDLMNGMEGAPLELFRKRITNPHADVYYGLANEQSFKRLKTPALLTTGWFDHCLTGGIDFFTLTQKHASAEQRKGTYLIIGPWDHGCKLPEEYDLGPNARALDFDAIEKDFLASYVCNRGDFPQPRVRLFVMGRNVWRNENEFPLARAELTKFYLHSSGAANTKDGWGTLSTKAPETEACDRFTYDPANPVPSIGGTNPGPASTLPMKRGPRNQWPALNREDVLVFSTEPLREPLEVTGPLKLVLYAASSATDTDFTAKLMDVSPDGNWMLLQDGIVRARYRNGIEHPKLLNPGEVERYEIDLWFTSNEFQPGHRIGLAISSSNFPRFNRNLNTGGDNERDSKFVVAEQRIYHDNLRPSHLLLPVVRSR